MTDDLSAIIAEMRSLCDRAEEIIKAGNAPLVQLAEVEPEPKPDDDRDDPNGGYWYRRCLEARAKLKAISPNAYEEEYNKRIGTWNWRAIAELYERRITALEAEDGR